MTTPFQERMTWGRGFVSNQSLVGPERIQDSLIPGSSNVWVPGPGRVVSWDGTLFFSGYGNETMMLSGDKIGTLAAGSVIVYRERSIYFIGSGSVRVGNDVFSFLFTNPASSQLQVRVPPTTGQEPLTSSGIEVTVGLAKPQPPGFRVAKNSDGSPKAGRAQGTFSVRASLYREVTGGEGNASEPSVIVTAADNTLAIQLPPAGSMSAASPSHINVYSTRRGFGAIGPWFFLTRIPVNTQRAIAEGFTVDPDVTMGTYIQLNYSDGDLIGGRFAPIDYDPPLPGTHCFSLGDVIVVAGVLGGSGLSPSIPGAVEAFSPLNITFLNPQEPIIGIRGRASDGWQYVFCRNSLHAVSLGDEVTPIIPRAIWPNTGIANKNAAAFVNSEFYGFSGKKGAVRTSGTEDPDSTFALPVENIMGTWNPNNVVVGYSHDDDCVVYFHGLTALPFMRKQGIWSAPFNLADGGAQGNRVLSAVEYKGKLIFATDFAAVGDGPQGVVMYEFSGGGLTTVPWKIVPAWRDGGAEGWYKTITGWRTSYNTGSSNLTSRLLTNFDPTTAQETDVSAGAGRPVYDDWVKTNVKDAKVFTLEQSGTGGGREVEGTTVIGGITKMRV